MWMADTVAVMNSGRIEQLGTPIDIYELPANPFVANFLGRSNLLAATVAGRNGDDLLLTAYGSRFVAPVHRSRSRQGTVWLGVRPEKVRLSYSDVDNQNNVHCVVTDICYAGVSTEYLLQTAWGQEICVFSANVEPDGPLKVGTEVTAYWHPGQSFVLDRG